jgi:glycosyltransferase involved in cell wall biosynthesis
MRLVYYTHPGFLDRALELIGEQSKRCELHLMLEWVPQSARSTVLGLRRVEGRPGLLDAGHFFDPRRDAAILDYLSKAKSVALVLHRHPRSLSPRTWRASCQAARHVRKLRPDVVHLEEPGLRLAPLVWMLRRIPLVISLHDARVRQGEEDWRISLARRLILPRARKVIVHSDYCLQALRSDWPALATRAEHVPLGGAYRVFRRLAEKSPTPSAGMTVLHLGRLMPYKGLELLFAAAPAVAAQVADVQFIIAGGPVKNYCVPPSPSLPNGGTIKVIPEYVDTVTLARLLEQARVVVCPYAQATQSGVVLTAFGFGKPVVATAVGGIPEYVLEGKTGLLVPPGDSLALAEAIARILLDQALYERLRAGIRDFAASENSWERLALRTLEVYQRAIEAKT